MKKFLILMALVASFSSVAETDCKLLGKAVYNQGSKTSWALGMTEAYLKLDPKGKKSNSDYMKLNRKALKNELKTNSSRVLFFLENCVDQGKTVNMNP